MGAAKSPREDGGTDRILVRAKSNIGPDGGGYAYSMVQAALPEHPGIDASSVVWGGPLDGTAGELLATAESAGDGEERTALTEAETFLRAELCGGDIPSKDLTKKAREAGISERTLKRAKQSLRIRARKDGATGAWYCSLPVSFPITGEVGQDRPPEFLDLLGPLGGENNTCTPTLEADQECQEEQEGQEGQQDQEDDVASLACTAVGQCLK